MSEDAHEIAQRIVREVLDAHEAEAARSAPPSNGAEPPNGAVEHGIDLRDAPAAVTADASAALLDDSTARLTARRIVAEVLASHAAAERDTSGELPVAAEGEAPGPAASTPVLHPITGRPAVLPSLPEEPDLDPDADLADDAAAIARRIVASVLDQRPPAGDGPPPVPDHVRVPVEVEGSDEPESQAEPEPQPESEPEPEPAPETVERVEVIDPVVVHGSHRLEPPAEPDVDEPTAMHAAVFAEAEPAPETTALLTPDEPVEADATLRVPVATVERPVVEDPAADPTLSLPSAEPPRRTGRWLLASILGAVALAVLLPLAVEALRTLVSLS